MNWQEKKRMLSHKNNRSELVFRLGAEASDSRTQSGSFCRLKFKARGPQFLKDLGALVGPAIEAMCGKPTYQFMIDRNIVIRSEPRQLCFCADEHDEGFIAHLPFGFHSRSSFRASRIDARSSASPPGN